MEFHLFREKILKSKTQWEQTHFTGPEIEIEDSKTFVENIVAEDVQQSPTIEDNTKSKDGPFCPMCSKQFFHQSNLRRHLIGVHHKNPKSILQAQLSHGESKAPEKIAFYELPSDKQESQGMEQIYVAPDHKDICSPEALDYEPEREKQENSEKIEDKKMIEERSDIERKTAPKQLSTVTRCRRHTKAIHPVSLNNYKKISKQSVKIKKYICEKCAKSFGSPNLFLQHFRIQHLANDNLDSSKDKLVGKFICPGCPERFSCSNSFRTHLKGVHGLKNKQISSIPTATRKYICDECTKPFYSKKSFLQHFQANHLAISEETLDKVSRGNLSRHTHRSSQTISNKLSVDDKSKKKIHKCSVCNKKYGSLYMLRNHFGERHSSVSDAKRSAEIIQLLSGQQDSTTLVGSGYVHNDSSDVPRCEKCNRTFENRIKFTRHIQFYHMKIGEEALKKCPYCPLMMCYTKASKFKTFNPLSSIDSDHQISMV